VLTSPYVLVGGHVDLRTEGPLHLEFPRDGERWHAVKNGDLDPLLPPASPACYSMHLRFSGSAQAIQHIAITADLQMAPLSLPALELGNNDLLYADESAACHAQLIHRWHERDDLLPPPTVAAPLHPIDGDQIPTTQPTFRWPDSPTTTDYRFELSLYPDMRYALAPVFEKLISHTASAGQAQWTPPEIGLLNPGQTYYWRVRPRSAEGLWGAWSPTWSFVPSAPGVPMDIRLYTDLTQRIITLHWRANPQGNAPAYYEIYGSDERGFSARNGEHEVFTGRESGLQTRWSPRVKIELGWVDYMP